MMDHLVGTEDKMGDSVTDLRWSKTDEHTWKAGPYEVFGVEPANGEGMIYEVCKQDDWLGDFDTLQEATDEANRHWNECLNMV